jgi:trehalose utilization protein
MNESVRLEVTDEGEPATHSVNEVFMCAEAHLYEGSRVAIAAARGRVLVTWLNDTKELTAGQSPGGYMVLGCE